MRYITYKLVWRAGYGYGPDEVLSDHDSKISGIVASPNVYDGLILAYLYGDIDLSLLENWSAVELTEGEALAFVKDINSDATLNTDGLIEFPFKPF